MEFIDHTGHIFSLPTFDDNPISLQYTENDYIFWIKDNQVSINNYYILPIRFLLDYDEYITRIHNIMESESIDLDEALQIHIKINSKFYKLIGPKYIQSKVEQNKDINEPIEFNLDDFKSELTLNDFYYDIEGDSDQNIIVYDKEHKFLLFPFYVIGKSEIEGTYLSNISIEISKFGNVDTNIDLTLDNDVMYDYYMKRVVSDINIYEYNLQTHQKKLWYTIKKGYDKNCDEILYPSYNDTEILNDKTFGKYVYSSKEPFYNGEEEQEKPKDVSYRIRHFIENKLPSDIFVYIHNLPMNKWLMGNDIYERENVVDKDGNLVYDEDGNIMTQWKIDPTTNWFIQKDGVLPRENNDICYYIDGKFKRSCHYCGSILRTNFDGSSVNWPENATVSEHDTSIAIDIFYDRENSKTTDNGTPLYPEDWENGQCKKMFISSTFPAFGSNLNGNGFDIGEEIDGALPLINLGDIMRINENIDPSGVVIKSGDAIYDKRPIIIRDIWFDIDVKLNTKIQEHKLLTEYTPITVGCTFIDECEELIINGRNMGIRLPKEILKAIYTSSFYNKYADEKLLKNKMKELLLNYMTIKGECGNFKSMINSLKWFGWKDHIEISQLIKTDNEFQNQFILDYFDINNDIKDTFKYFNKTNNITLTVLSNKETGNNYLQNFDEALIGEGKPELENLFDKVVETQKDDIVFYKSYYNFMFNELALKLDCLRYYYQQYFLPVHININRASIAHKVYANTTKLSVIGYDSVMDKPIYLPEDAGDIHVIFPDTHRLLFKQDNHVIDNHFNEFSNYDNDYHEELYYVNENCVTIPIQFVDNSNKYCEDKFGDYYIDDEGNYVKINFFYKMIDEHNGQLSNRFNGTHYSLVKNENIQKLSELTSKRYVKISEGYLNCKILLTATIIEQNDLGHYVKFDNNYLYKENFYDKDYTNLENLINENSIIESGNYIKYYNNFIRIDSKNRYNIETITLVNDNIFNYYQNSNQYYKNFIVIPRLLNNNIDYEKAYFRLSVLVNNKWFNYDFRIVTPNIYLDLGKLEYKYSITSGENKYYPFRQLRSLSPLKFNSFMYEPDLVSINALFTEVDQNNNTKVLTFIDKLLETDNDEHEADDNKMYNFYKKYYSNVLRIPYNKKYYNRIHLFNITDAYGNAIQYNENQNLTTLYSIFFNNDLSYKYQLKQDILYDYYLMHNDKEWYIVVISQYPIASYIDPDLLKITDRTHIIGGYNITYADYSIDKFLVNRMIIKKTNGYNHFNVDDLIVVSINNNDYQFNIDLNNKWTIQPIYDIKDAYDVKSNTNIMIIPNNNIDNLYTPGYYNVKLEYTINGLNNILHNVLAQYRVLNQYKTIEYPEIIEPTEVIETIPIEDTISDFTILYENDNGEQYKTKEVLDPSLGWKPFGIKIMNAGYFGPEQTESIYIGLKLLSISNPENGYQSTGSQPSNDIPYLGFNTYDIEGLKNYSFIAYKDESHQIKLGYNGDLVYPQTDFIELDSIPKNSDGTPTYPAPNNRAFSYPIENNMTLNILNDDDTLNMALLDDNCAAGDWRGKENTQVIIDSFDMSTIVDWPDDPDHILDDEWKHVPLTRFNTISAKFSPACACAWRYHTRSTKQGDWYIPAYAEVFFLSYNLKRLSELFANIAEKYPDECKSDLLINLYQSQRALWTTTEYNQNYMWEIHPGRHAHILSKSTKWSIFPYIRVKE